MPFRSLTLRPTAAALGMADAKHIGQPSEHVVATNSSQQNSKQNSQACATPLHPFLFPEQILFQKRCHHLKAIIAGLSFLHHSALSCKGADKGLLAVHPSVAWGKHLLNLAERLRGCPARNTPRSWNSSACQVSPCTSATSQRLPVYSISQMHLSL